MTGDQQRGLLAEFDEQIAHVPASVDRAAIKRMRTVAYALDDGIRVPGIGYRIGIDPLIGVLPGVGDVLTADSRCTSCSSRPDSGCHTRHCSG